MSQPLSPPAILPAIPEGLPFLVRLKPTAHVLRHLRIQLAIFVPFGILLCVAGIYMLTSGEKTVHSDRYGDLPAPLMGWLAIALGIFCAVGMAVESMLKAGKGPAVGADRNGVYIRPGLDKKRTVFLPWQHIESIEVRDYRGPNLVVKPFDARLEEEFAPKVSGGAAARAGQRRAIQRQLKKLGTFITIPVGGAPLEPQEILRQITQWRA
jgi:hypothetical protein